MAESELAADITQAALRLLVRREHSRAELNRKLLARGFSTDGINTVLDLLSEDGSQSDQRFAEAYVRQRANRHYGPVKIRAELAARGIPGTLASAAIADLEIDWAELARAWVDRGGKRLDMAVLTDRAKLTRRLFNRGFSSGQISAALKQHS